MKFQMKVYEVYTMLDRTLTSLLVLLLALSAPVFSSGQAEIQNSSPDKISLTDSRGQEILLTDYPKRVISLGPNLTETIFALGKGGLLVGRTDYGDYPAQVKSIPTVGSLQEPNIETIINLEPDLALASTHVSEETIQTLEEAGIKVALLYGPNNFSGLSDVINGCGTLLDARQEADQLMADINRRLKIVTKEVDRRTYRPRVYYALGFGDGGDWTSGAGTFISTMIEMAGGENIVKQKGWSYSKELLVEADPDIIIMAQGKKETFLSLPIYKDLKASLNGRIYEIDENILVRQGPRLIDGLETLSALLKRSHEE